MSRSAELTSVMILTQKPGHFMIDNALGQKTDAVFRAREFLDHLVEHRDYFFVETGYMTIEVFFIDKKEAVLFKLRF